MVRRPVVPPSLLARFADPAGRLIAERRDRSRRLLVPVVEAVARAGTVGLAPGGAAGRLTGLLDHVEARASDAVAGVLAGAFPPAGDDRAALALFVAVLLLVGPGHRERTTRAAALLGHMIAGSLPDAAGAGDAEEADEADVARAPGEAEAADEPDEEEAGGEEADEAEVEEPEGGAEPGEPDAVETAASLATAPELARLLAARTWQLVRFPARLLLTSDTPAVLWTRPGSATAHRWGLGGADELRLPLDPRHALILARRAPAGEVVRELDERHARALNRTVAEAAHAWIYYHPESDPLERVELG